ncbi:hypothetical protein L6386_05625 [bacterium]|nr:hypothetical protein [bacterium]MBU4561175.1 hypothetical protein [bacterium]MCG2676525.1 hypothetical protein [bacterium]MCG2678018.1 hypothetical protein [bacterium]
MTGAQIWGLIGGVSLLLLGIVGIILKVFYKGEASLGIELLRRWTLFDSLMTIFLLLGTGILISGLISLSMSEVEEEMRYLLCFVGTLFTLIGELNLFIKIILRLRSPKK